jgi:hypothetical protein
MMRQLSSSQVVPLNRVAYEFATVQLTHVQRVTEMIAHWRRMVSACTRNTYSMLAYAMKASTELDNVVLVIKENEQ